MLPDVSMWALPMYVCTVWKSSINLDQHFSGSFCQYLNLVYRILWTQFFVLNKLGLNVFEVPLFLTTLLVSRLIFVSGAAHLAEWWALGGALGGQSWFIWMFFSSVIQALSVSHPKGLLLQAQKVKARREDGTHLLGRITLSPGPLCVIYIGCADSDRLGWACGQRRSNQW